MLALLRVPGINFDHRGAKRIIIFSSLQGSEMTPGVLLGSKLTHGTLLHDYFKEPLLRLAVKIAPLSYISSNISISWITGQNVKRMHIFATEVSSNLNGTLLIPINPHCPLITQVLLNKQSRLIGCCFFHQICLLGRTYHWFHKRLDVGTSFQFHDLSVSIFQCPCFIIGFCLTQFPKVTSGENRKTSGSVTQVI